VIEPCPRIPWWVGYEMLYCGFTSRSLRLLCLAEESNTATASSASCHCWKYFFCLTVAFSDQAEIGSINSNHNRTTLFNSFASPYQYQTLQVVSLSCRIRPLASPRRPNRQLGARRAHLPASTFTTIMATNYLGIIIGFPVLLVFAITQPPWAFDTAS
jgi:hypothetical protein